MSKIVEISQYEPSSEDRFFFDANVWMYLFCPIGNYNQERVGKYGAFLKKVLGVHARIYVNALILSEFYNSYARLEFNLWKRKPENRRKTFKKYFRRTTEYQQIAEQIEETIRYDIFEIAQPLDDKFSKLDLDRLFFGIEASDFNDNYYLALAEQKDMVFVTDDRDFGGNRFNTTILSANAELLEKA